MDMPSTGLLIAQIFGVIVQFLCKGGHSETIFPMFDGPRNFQEHVFMSFALIQASHYNALELANGASLHALNGTWRNFRNEQAMEWETLYQHRLPRVHIRTEYFDLT